MNICRNKIEYAPTEEFSKFATEWVNAPLGRKNEAKAALMLIIDSVKVLETPPTLPYKFPYSYDSPTTVQCDSLPTLPTGVTLLMVKQQLNEASKIMGLTLPFPEVEYNYTMLYIILLLVLVVVVVAIYAMTRSSKTGVAPIIPR